MAIIVTIVGVGLPIYTLTVDMSRRSRTRALVTAIATAIASYPRKSIDWPDGSVRRLWDVDGNQILDGAPSTLGASAAGAATVGYRGFLAASGLAVDPGMRDAGDQVLDAWKRPLRIRFASGPDDQRYGAAGVGIWSYGAPGPSTTDLDLPREAAAAITSWGGRP